MPAHDPYILDLIAKNHIRPEPGDTDDLDAVVHATDAELRGIAIRQKVFFLWLAEHWTRQGTPAAGTGFCLDAYIRALVHRHGLTRQAGEDDAELTHRALACEVVAEAARAQMLGDWTDAEAGTDRASRIDSRARPPGRRRRPARRRPSQNGAPAGFGPTADG